VIHAVESKHGGNEASSVLYIPAVPYTPMNAEYVKAERDNFLQGIPPPDFPGGVGESNFVGRGDVEDIMGELGRAA
jgi:hypothetical protein